MPRRQKKKRKRQKKNPVEEAAASYLCNADVKEYRDVHILTDSKLCVGLLARNWQARSNTALVAAVRAQIMRCSNRSVSLHWVAGHAGVPGNERADALATRGVNRGGDFVVENYEEVVTGTGFELGLSFVCRRGAPTRPATITLE